MEKWRMDEIFYKSLFLIRENSRNWRFSFLDNWRFDILAVKCF